MKRKILLLLTAFTLLYTAANAQDWNKLQLIRVDSTLAGWYSLTMAGDYAIMGDDLGLATVIKKQDDGRWGVVQEITGVYHIDENSQISSSGDYVISGSPSDDTDAYGGNEIKNAGAAYVFYNHNGTWEIHQKLVTSDRSYGDNFGYCVSMSGDYALIGAKFANPEDENGDEIQDAGAAYIFYNNNGIWEQDQKLSTSDLSSKHYFGKAVALSGDYALITGQTTDDNHMGVYAFYNNGGTWEEQQIITCPLVGKGTDAFGGTLCIAGNNAFIGDYNYNAGGLQSSGCVYVYKYDNGTWKYVQQLLPPEAQYTGSFGEALAANGNCLAVGAPSRDVTLKDGTINHLAGEVYLYRNNGTVWEWQQTLSEAETDLESHHFGRDMAITDDYLLVRKNKIYKDKYGDIHRIRELSIYTTLDITGIAELKDAGFSLFPNPVSHTLTIDGGNSTISRVELYTLNGKLVKQVSNTGAIASIDLSSLGSTMYIVKVNTSKGVYATKIMKE